MERFERSEHVARIRKNANHPFIDSDGHIQEFAPVAFEYVVKAGGSDMMSRFYAQQRFTSVSREWYGLSESERRARWTHRPAHWGQPLRNRGLDLATAMFPDLMYQRLDELGIDYAVLFPTLGIIPQTYGDEDTRRATCRGFNDYYADHWMGHPDRMTPVAAIPMHTPQEALEEIDYAVVKRGFKVLMLPSWIKRPVKAIVDKHPEALRFAWRADTFGIDSEHDYDPVWKRCVELGVVPCFHGTGETSTFHNSISNIVYNHVGHFAASASAICKSLFLGGVSQRFPQLNFLFLEGGVGWARSLLADLTGHWEKRNLGALADDLDPRRMDLDLFQKLYRDYGGSLFNERLTREDLARRWKVNPEDPTDPFPRLNVKSKQELRDLFLSTFYFGCEGDDPITPSAFDRQRNPGRCRFNAVYGSDIGHWDVPLMRDVLEEAYEPVEKGLMTTADLRDFVFTNPVRLWTANNPDFFRGTVVEQAVAKLKTTVV